MREPKRLLPLIVNTGLILALLSAVLLSSCAKNSGSFQNTPAEHLKSQSEQAPNMNLPTPQNQTPVPAPVAETKPAAPATTPAPTIANKTATTTKASPQPEIEFRSKVQIQSLPTQPPEFLPPVSGDSPILNTPTPSDAGKTYERYKDIEATAKEAQTPKQAIFETFPLAWESPQHPERKNWSRYTYQIINQTFDSLDQATDAETFCKHYGMLEKRYKVIFWGMLISQISFHESGWNPTSRSLEKTMGVDGITKMAVYSEGLLQLSYQDSQWSPYCKFDWSKDQKLTAKDPNKTILNPYLNLSCGIKVLADQISRYKQIAMKKNIYWSVIHQDGEYSKIPEMAAAIQRRLPFCR